MNFESPPQHIDIHSHLNFAAFDADRDMVVKRAHKAGVWMINVGTQRDTSLKAVELAESYQWGVYAIIGLHPIHTGKSFHDKAEVGEGGQEFTSRGEVFDYEYYRMLALHSKVLAIGECGLDYFGFRADRWSDASTHAALAKQEEAFRRQIELAIEVRKPLMLHLRSGGGRSAYQDALSILRSYLPKIDFFPKGNLHFFAGSIDEAKSFLDAGFTFSFTGVITFARGYDEIIRYLPFDRILSETDCPYVAPIPYRGQRNEPVYVTEVVKKIAAIRGEDLSLVQAQLLKNAFNLFHLTPNS
jgi:TatD DNase family protein